MDTEESKQLHFDGASPLPGGIRSRPSSAKSMPRPAGLPPLRTSESRPAEMTEEEARQTLMALRIQEFWRKEASTARKRLWKATATIERRKNRALKSQIQEICIYVIFLTLFTISSILVVQDQKLFLLAKQIRGQVAEQEFEPDVAHIYKDMFDVETIGEFYDWIMGPVYGTLYTDGTMEGGDDAKIPGTLFGVNYIIGGIGISQVRAKARACEKKHGFRFTPGAQGMQCHGDPDDKGEFDLAWEQTEPFGQNGEVFYWNGTGHGESYWSTQHERDHGYSRRSNWATSYPAGAYRVILPNHNATEAWTIINKLQQSSYFDVQTRALFVEFTVYNPNLDYFCHVFCTFEQKPSGGILPTFQTDVLRLYTLVESTSIVTIILEVLVAIFYMYYFVQEFRRACKDGPKKYLSSIENAVQNLNLFMYLLTWLFRLMMSLNLPPEEDVIVDSDTFYPFHVAAAYKAIAIYCNSFNAFLCWFKLVKYMGLLPNYALITGTITRAASGVRAFSVAFMVVFYGFCAAFMMTFGSKVSGYRNMTQSASSLLRSLLGDFDFDELQNAQWFMGPFLFVLFVGVAVFVVLNALISIIGESYEAQRAELENSKDVQLGKEMGQYIHDVLMELPIVGRFFRATKDKARAALNSVGRAGQNAVNAGTPIWNRLGSAVTTSRSGSLSGKGTSKVVPTAAAPKPGGGPGRADAQAAGRTTTTTTNPNGTAAVATTRGLGATSPPVSSSAWRTSSSRLKELDLESTEPPRPPGSML